jgi:hypothetical protein
MLGCRVLLLYNAYSLCPSLRPSLCAYLVMLCSLHRKQSAWEIWHITLLQRNNRVVAGGLLLLLLLFFQAGDIAGRILFLREVNGA